jgi:hypothetical protein
VIPGHKVLDLCHFRALKPSTNSPHLFAPLRRLEDKRLRRGGHREGTDHKCDVLVDRPAGGRPVLTFSRGDAVSQMARSLTKSGRLCTHEVVSTSLDSEARLPTLGDLPCACPTEKPNSDVTPGAHPAVSEVPLVTWSDSILSPTERRVCRLEAWRAFHVG